MSQTHMRTSGPPSPNRQQRARGVVPVLAVLAVVLVVLILLSPKQPVAPAAANVSGSQTQENASTGSPFLHVTEAMSSNKTAYPDETGAFPDWIELTNEGTESIDLEGYGLSDKATKIAFTFPRMTLAPGERVVVFASDDHQSQTGATLHAKFKLSSAGDMVVLFGPDGVVLETLSVPAMSADMSYAKTDDGFIITEMYTPGYENTQQGYADFRSSTYLETGALIISEVVASNITTIRDDDGDFSDWIEIYNTTGRTIDLSNYALSDDPQSPVKWRFPAGCVIEPYGYYVVFASDKDRASNVEGGWPHASFKLRSNGETVLISDIQGRLIDQTAYDNLAADCSWGRDASNSWTVFSTPTPGLPNNQQGFLAMESYTLASNPSGLYITEVMTSNQSFVGPGVQNPYDYIEIYNISGQAVNLKGYGLSDNVKKPRKWQFPDLTIENGESLVIYCDTSQTSKAGSYTFTNYNLSVAGETVVLSDPGGHILDKMVVPKLYSDMSYGRTLGRAGLFYYSNPTPGRINEGGFTGFAQAPTFITRGGMYDNVLRVEIDVPEGTTVYYTTDATDPSTSSTLYTGPIEVGVGATVIRARAFANDLEPSQIETQTYFVSIYHTMPVISLVTDPENVWNEETGMLADGPDLDRETQEPPWKNATYWKKLHYTGFMEYYDEEGVQQISQGINFHVMGQYSLDMPQKSFSVRADGQFGSSTFDYAFFDDRPFTSYRALAIRNGGQDGKYTRVLEGMMHRLIDQTDTTVVTQAWDPVIVYLNGAYWGHYNLRERVGADMLAQHEGWEDPNDLDILESDGMRSSQINQGSNSDYKKLVEYVESHDLVNDPAALEYVLSQVDIDNMIDYFFFEMFYMNTDPGNIRFYRNAKTGDGKWRYVIYDLDWGLFSSDPLSNAKTTKTAPSYFFYEGGMGSQRITSNVLIRNLIKVPEIQDKFLRRSGQLFQTVFTTENMLSLFNEMVAEIEPEMQMHFTRWAEEMHPKISFDQPKNAAGAYNYWVTRCNRARNVLSWRPYIFWNDIKEYFGLSDAKMIEYYGECPPDNKS